MQSKRFVIRRRLRAVSALTAFSVLAVAALGLAASAAKYQGKTKGGGAVSFQVAGGSVRRFQASVSVSCISAASSRSETSIYVVAPEKPGRLDGRSRFTLTVNKPKEQFKDATGKIIATLYSVKATVQGRAAGRSASGTVKVTYNTYWMAYNPATGFSQLALAACFSGKTAIPWTAKQK